VTGAALSRSTCSSRPRTCRSVPAQACGRRTGRSSTGLPAATQAHVARSGQLGQRGARAVQTSAPSSISAIEAVAAASASTGSSCSTRARARRVTGASARPSTARATTRRTLVSTTGTRWR